MDHVAAHEDPPQSTHGSLLTTPHPVELHKQWLHLLQAVHPMAPSHSITDKLCDIHPGFSPARSPSDDSLDSDGSRSEMEQDICSSLNAPQPMELSSPRTTAKQTNSPPKVALPEMAPPTPPTRKRKRGRKPIDKSFFICYHCNTTQTPEWRRGPNGANTLCNACGLKYAKVMRKERERKEGKRRPTNGRIEIRELLNPGVTPEGEGLSQEGECTEELKE